MDRDGPQICKSIREGLTSLLEKKGGGMDRKSISPFFPVDPHKNPKNLKDCIIHHNPSKRGNKTQNNFTKWREHNK